MNSQASRTGTEVLLSFSSAHADLARQIAGELKNAKLDIRYDPWVGAGGVSATQSVRNRADDAAFVIPLLTPSEATPTWVGDEWKQTIFDEACARGIAVLPVWADGELDAVPEFLRDRSFANLRDGDRAHEVRRLVDTIRDLSGDHRISVPRDRPAMNSARNPTAISAHPIILELGTSLASRLSGDEAQRFLDELVPMMRDGLYFELGVKFPTIHLQTGTDLPPWDFRIVINDVPDSQLTLHPNAVMVNDSVDALAKLGVDAEPAINPASAAQCAWVPADAAETAHRNHLVTWDLQGFLVLGLSAALRRRAVDFIGVSEVRAMLHQIEPSFPCLVSEAVPKTVPLFVLADVLRRLVAEGVCVRNLRRILMTLSDRGRTEQDPLYLTEYVRAALQREITHRLSRGTKQLIVLLLDPDIENEILGAIRYTATGSYVDLDPARLRQIMDALREPMSAFPSDAQLPQVLTVMGIRAPVRRLVASSMPQLHVLSYSELQADANIQPVGRITFDGFRGRPGVRAAGKLLWG